MAGPRLQSSPLPHRAYPALANHGAHSPAHTVRATAPSVYQMCRQLAVHKLIHFIAISRSKIEPPIVKESEIVRGPLSAIARRSASVAIITTPVPTASCSHIYNLHANHIHIIIDMYISTVVMIKYGVYADGHRQ